MVKDGDIITIDIPNRTLTVDIPAEEMQTRLANFKPLKKPGSSFLDRYSALVTSADTGAVLKLPTTKD